MAFIILIFLAVQCSIAVDDVLNERASALWCYEEKEGGGGGAPKGLAMAAAQLSACPLGAEYCWFLKAAYIPCSKRKYSCGEQATTTSNFVERICIAASITCAESEDEHNRRCSVVLAVCVLREILATGRRLLRSMTRRPRRRVWPGLKP